jgi:DNA-binding beta-propeller fold protein YncE
MIVGQGNYRYEAIPGWGQGPDGRQLGIVSSATVDSQDRVYMVDREPNPAIVVFDRDGHFLKSWGEDFLSLPHGIWVGPDDRLYIADCGDHTVRICSTDGEVLQTLGTPGQPGAEGQPFNKPTRAVCAPAGEIYVSDGYGQNYVHRFAADGTYIQSWGGTGSEPGQFTLPHNVFAAPDGRILVADRESNHRIQIFEPDGTFLTQWPSRLFPCGLFIDAEGTVFVTEGGGVSIFNIAGQLQAQWPVYGGPNDRPHGAHNIWVDRHGDLYVGEVLVENLFYKFKRV